MTYPPQPPQQPQQPQQPPAPPQYPQQQYGQYAQAPAQQRSTLAIVGFILSLVAVPLFLLGIVGWLVNLTAFILSLVANSQIKNSNGQLSGKGLAVAGIVLSCVWFGLLVLGLIIAMVYGMAIMSLFM